MEVRPQTYLDFQAISQKREAGENIYTASTANVYDPATAMFALTRGIEEHVSLAQLGSLDGIEYWPNNPILAPIKPTYFVPGGLDDYIGSIISAHQSPRGETFLGITPTILRNLPGILGEGRPAIARYIGSYLLLTDPHGSLKTAKAIHNRIGQLGFDNSHFTTNVYPDLAKTPDQKKELDNQPNPVVQTRPEACEAMGIETPEQMVERAKSSGFNWCISTYHMLREPNRKPHFINDWRTVIPQLTKGGVVAQTHVEILRTDMPGDQTQTILAGRDMVNPSSEVTDIKAIIRLIAENWRGHVTLEATTGGMKQLGYATDGRVKEQDIINYYRDYREVVGRIFR